MHACSPFGSRISRRRSTRRSQIGQDLLLDRWLLDGRQDGVFVDVGAHDGITFNNTLFLQNERNWSGIPMRRLDTLLVEVGTDRVTVLSIDVERGERGVLDSIRLHDFGIEVVVIKNNCRSWSIARRLLAQGYQLLCRLGWDEVDVPNPPRL